jgi:hypothetical protein
MQQNDMLRGILQFLAKPSYNILTTQKSGRFCRRINGKRTS